MATNEFCGVLVYELHGMLRVGSGMMKLRRGVDSGGEECATGVNEDEGSGACWRWQRGSSVGLQGENRASGNGEDMRWVGCTDLLEMLCVSRVGSRHDRGTVLGNCTNSKWRQ